MDSVWQEGTKKIFKRKIYSGFLEKMGSCEILTIFFLTFLGATARNASAPAFVASL